MIAMQLHPARTIRQWLRLPVNQGPLLSTAFVSALLIASLAALPFDHRTILGLNPWIKPIKFDISSIIFVLTMAVLLSLLENRSKSRMVIGWGVGIAMIVENAIISLQSLRGVPSHMNYTSAFNGVAFGVMGIFIVFNTVLVAWLLWLYCTRKPTLPTALTWGIRLGLLAILAGSVEGYLIVVHGGHTVGAVDGLPGLPFVNWSRDHGDLRIPHFFALHALQAMPLAGWALSKSRWPGNAQVAVMFTTFAVYMGGVWLLFSEAMRGTPLGR